MFKVVNLEKNCKIEIYFAKFAIYELKATFYQDLNIHLYFVIDFK